ncbi:MAG: hypothetical protein R3C01_07800 [Planctomycetaceae bacterium]
MADWLSPHQRWSTVPSWMMSVFGHGVLFAVLVIAARLPGCQGELTGSTGDAVREVGIHLKPSPPAPNPHEQEQPQQQETNAAAPAFAALDSATPESIPALPPIPLSTPNSGGTPMIGAGGLPSTRVGSGLPVASLGAGRATPSSAGGGPAATSMFGIQDAGRRIVYLIDSSSSMDADASIPGSHSPLHAAKLELLASLADLTPEQEFQVIFCNTSERNPVVTLKPARFAMFHGTDSSRLDVRLQVDSIRAAAGTDHRLGLTSAMKFNPDVIFYLSDAGEPFLTARELDDLRQLNRGARIHTIHFGLGPEVNGDGGALTENFLQKLSRQNQGKYAYRDIRQLGRR